MLLYEVVYIQDGSKKYDHPTNNQSATGVKTNQITLVMYGMIRRETSCCGCNDLPMQPMAAGGGGGGWRSLSG